jgi:hypothetical protein
MAADRAARNAVAGPLTTEYGPCTEGKRKIVRTERITTKVSSHRVRLQIILESTTWLLALPIAIAPPCPASPTLVVEKSNSSWERSGVRSKQETDVIKVYAVVSGSGKGPIRFVPMKDFVLKPRYAPALNPPVSGIKNGYPGAYHFTTKKYIVAVHFASLTYSRVTFGAVLMPRYVHSTAFSQFPAGSHIRLLRAPR